MRIVGILVAYDEHPHWLATAVTGWSRLCDDIVYVDGSYVLYPNAKPRGHILEAEAVIEAAEAANVGLLAYRPREVFYGNEVEKRNTSLRLAATLEPDWLCVFDADYQITRCESNLARADLEATDMVAATFVRVDTKMTENGLDIRWKNRIRGIYRWTPDLEYGPAHWTISGTYDGERKWVWGPEHVPGGASAVEPALDLDSIVCTHRTDDRPKDRRNRMLEYSKIRDAHEVEKVDRDVFAREALVA